MAIEATDLELTARRVVRGDVTVDGAGSVVVPAKALVKAVAAMTEPEIVLESDPSDGRAESRCAGRYPNRDAAGLADRGLAGRPAGGRDRPDRLDRRAGDGRRVRAGGPVRVGRRVAAGPDVRGPVLPGGSAGVSRSWRPTRTGWASPGLPLEAGFRVSDGPLLVPARAIRLLAKQLKGVEGAVQVRALEASGGDAIARIAHRVQPSRCRVDGSNRRGGVPELEAGRAEPGGWVVRVRSGRARFGPASRGLGPLDDGSTCPADPGSHVLPGPQGPRPGGDARGARRGEVLSQRRGGDGGRLQPRLPRRRHPLLRRRAGSDVGARRPQAGRCSRVRTGATC